MSPLEGTGENDLLLALSSTDKLEGGERSRQWEMPVGTEDGLKQEKACWIDKDPALCFSPLVLLSYPFSILLSFHVY